MHLPLKKPLHITQAHVEDIRAALQKENTQQGTAMYERLNKVLCFVHKDSRFTAEGSNLHITKTIYSPNKLQKYTFFDFNFRNTIIKLFQYSLHLLSRLTIVLSIHHSNAVSFPLVKLLTKDCSSSHLMSRIFICRVSRKS